MSFMVSCICRLMMDVVMTIDASCWCLWLVVRWSISTQPSAIALEQYDQLAVNLSKDFHAASCTWWGSPSRTA